MARSAVTKADVADMRGVCVTLKKLAISQEQDKLHQRCYGRRKMPIAPVSRVSLMVMLRPGAPKKVEIAELRALSGHLGARLRQSLAHKSLLSGRVNAPARHVHEQQPELPELLALRAPPIEKSSRGRRGARSDARPRARRPRAAPTRRGPG